MWRQLDIAGALADGLGPRRFRTDIERVIFALVANRAIVPSSNLAVADWVTTSVVIPGLEVIDKDQAMRAMDLLGGRRRPGEGQRGGVLRRRPAVESQG
ncbi:hypothetical protein [Nocardia terpenica]|uniref:Uncharacterized protein n=1 Tax=Nocardia terpenica TaxID=455432 RepID=A0A6G9ZD53_9NOCA|nr:hypothetical protein [Nocardia terpenica]QIS23549.1 hypothetical protein F6W96_39980 [Nocardia terpenica]